MRKEFRIVTLHEMRPVDDDGLSLSTFIGKELETIEANTPQGAIMKFRRSSACASRSNHPIVVAIAK